MSAIYYHGTSADHLDDILKNGLRAGKKNWTVSEDDSVYFWSPKELAKANSEDYDSEPRQFHDDAFQRASDSATFAVATAKDCRRIVVAVELEDDEVSPDYSCLNMGGAVATWNEEGLVPTSKIRAIWIDGEDLSILRGYFLGMRISRENDLGMEIDISPIEREVAQMMLNNESCNLIDLVCDLRWNMKKIYLSGTLPDFID